VVKITAGEILAADGDEDTPENSCRYKQVEIEVASVGGGKGKGTL